MNRLSILNLVVLVVVNLCAANNVEYDGMINVILQHGLDGTEHPVFTERGNISIPSLRLGTSIVNQKPLTTEERAKLRTLAINNQYYQMKAIVNSVEGSHSYVSFVKACMLAESELTDIITITLDYAGHVISVTELVASTSTCEGVEIAAQKLKEFGTSVHVRHTHSGPSPDTASYIQKLERDREAKDRGEVKDNRSFLAKYWMYIVPVVIIMVLSSAANPESGGGGGGGR